MERTHLNTRPLVQLVQTEKSHGKGTFKFVKLPPTLYF